MRRNSNLSTRFPQGQKRELSLSLGTDKSETFPLLVSQGQKREITAFDLGTGQTTLLHKVQVLSVPRVRGVKEGGLTLCPPSSLPLSSDEEKFLNSKIERRYEMNETETIEINDTMRELRALIKKIEGWRIDNKYCDQRHTAMVLTKLEEAELIAQRMMAEAI